MDWEGFFCRFGIVFLFFSGVTAIIAAVAVGTRNLFSLLLKHTQLTET